MDSSSIGGVSDAPYWKSIKIIRMKTLINRVLILAAVVAMMPLSGLQAQFTVQWLDIGEYQANYVESIAQDEINGAPNSQAWPAFMRNTFHDRAEAFWIGAKNWTDQEGTTWPYYNMRIGPRAAGVEYVFPVENRIISRTDQTEVTVDGAASFKNVVVVDEVDPSIPADRLVRTIANTSIGITVERTAYAWVNQNHDDYHIVTWKFTNTGNTDGDDDIELPNNQVNDARMFWIHRWAGSNISAWNNAAAQTWGKFSMVDVVGDGNADYPVDFTAIYLWQGFDPEVTYQNTGGPIWRENQWSVPGDTLGALWGATMVGEMYLKLEPATDGSDQPSTLHVIDSDEPLNADGAPEQDYYELAIRSRENPVSRMWPHYADRIEPAGNFDAPTNDASSGKQGGFAATTAIGPYDLAFGDSFEHVVVKAVGGLEAQAMYEVGRAYKLGGQDDTQIIEYDADHDGTIDTTPYDPSTYKNGAEAMTKGQWGMSTRDSLFATFERGRNVWNNGNLASYPIPEAPSAPATFDVFGRPDQIELSWAPGSGGGAVSEWEVYRTSKFDDWMYAKCSALDLSCEVGYELVTTLPAGTTSYNDTDVIRGTDYYYHVVAVGTAQASDPLGINGTFGGRALRSSRYMTQTYQPVNLKRPPGGTIGDAVVVPNPVILGSDPSVSSFDREDEIAFFDIPGLSTIEIFSEIGERIELIEHTDGSGDEKWNLTTSARQLLVSGIYLAVITNTESGESVVRKFTVIR